MPFSLKHWLKHTVSSRSQLVMHSNEISSHRFVHAIFKSGTLRNNFIFSITNRLLKTQQLTSIPWEDQNHLVGTKPTRVIVVSEVKISFLQFFKYREIEIHFYEDAIFAIHMDLTESSWKMIHLKWNDTSAATSEIEITQILLKIHNR